ncbi:MAG: ThuA domain-containing protein [Planctomycetaceae bacterium]
MRCFQSLILVVVVSLLIGTIPLHSEEPSSIEVLPSDPKLAKIVLIAGSNVFKPGEHEYVAGCAVLRDLLKQSPGVAPVLALDWPKKPETLAGAKSVLFLFDGGEKHQLLGADRMAQVRKLADEGVGFVGLHQFVDVPKDLGDRMCDLMGAAWEKGHSQRAHWVHKYATFAEHPVSRGVAPFQIDDGYLFKLRFVPEMKGVTPLLRTVSPKAARQELTDEAIVAWLYERANGGRSFTFTGTHLHASLAEEGYRRFLVNGILWTAGVEIPNSGAPVSLTPEGLKKYLKPAPVTAAQ